MGEDSYPLYRRRGRYTVTKSIRRPDHTVNDYTFTDCNVVPYNPYLAKKYNCHLNVEVCSSIKAVKYLYKYIHKGPDKATVVAQSAGTSIETIEQNHNEIQLFQDARYFSAAEGCWRIFGYNMHTGSSAVQRLQLHLPFEQMVYYAEDDSIQNIIGNSRAQRTTLTAWFDLNNPESEHYDSTAQEIKYQDIPYYYTWKPTPKA